MTYQAMNYEKLLGTDGFSNQLLTNHFTLYNGYVTNTNKLMDELAHAGPLSEGGAVVEEETHGASHYRGPAAGRKGPGQRQPGPRQTGQRVAGSRQLLHFQYLDSHWSV